MISIPEELLELVDNDDQFEEFFIRLSPEFRSAFIAELGAVYDAHDVPVKVVLSLREGWLASVDEIENRIPEVFRIKMRLLPLTRDQARQAVTAPVERLGVNFEPELVAQLLADLAGGQGTTVMPPQLQLVCGALYDGLEPGEPQITLAAYQRPGGARPGRAHLPLGGRAAHLRRTGMVLGVFAGGRYAAGGQPVRGSQLVRGARSGRQRVGVGGRLG